jgi:Glycosyl transferase 4-like domain
MGTAENEKLHRSSDQLFYVVDWLPPDFGAVGQYGAIFARAIAAAGRDVRLIGLTTGRQRTTREALPNGKRLEITRLRSTIYQKSRYLNRMLWTVRADLRLVSEIIRDPRSRRAEVIFTGAPPFMLFFVLLVKVIRRARLVYRITDFYPEVLIAELGRRSWLRAIERLTWFLRRRVDAFEVLGEDQRDLLIAGGIAADRIFLKRDISPVEIRGDEQPVAIPAPLKGTKILLYSGNYSVAHDIETVVRGLIRHHHQGAGAFGLWLNATGARASIVEQQLRDAGVPVTRSQPGPLENLARLLVTADAHLISLRPEFCGIVLPSKVFGCIASRRPILFVGPAGSDVHLLCRDAGLPAYERVEAGDIAGFAAALDRLACLEEAPIFSSCPSGRELPPPACDDSRWHG